MPLARLAKSLSSPVSSPAKSARAAARPNLAQARQAAARRTAAAAAHAPADAARQAGAAVAKPVAAPEAKPVAAPAVKPAAGPAPAALADVKVVRDGFTMPQSDYDMLKALKIQCLANGMAVKKSELLRAGVQALAAMQTEKLIEKLRALPEIKAGRKKKKE